MKRGFIIGGLIFLAIILAIFSLTPLKFTGNVIISVENVTGSDHLINIQDFRYSPHELTISLGETVRWTNLDTTKHTVTSTGEGPLNSILLGKKETYSYTFEEVGEYTYYCIPHPYMKGKIIVE